MDKFKERSASLWRWVAGFLAAMAVSNFGTAIAFRTSPSDIKKVVQEQFTETSREHGLYAIEGRPRISRIEHRYDAIESKLSSISTDIAVIKNRLENGSN